MPSLTRWQFARQHTEPTWREILGLLIGGGLYLVLSRRNAWDEKLSPIIGAILTACVGALLVYAGEFLWHSLRAYIVQDREELAVVRAENQELRQAQERPRKQLFNVPAGLNLAALEFQAQAARTVPQAAVDELARLRVEGLRLIREEVQGIDNWENWGQREEAWLQAILAHLRSQFSEAIALSVEHLGPIPRRRFLQSFNTSHERIRANLSRRLEILDKIIAGHSPPQRG